MCKLVVRIQEFAEAKGISIGALERVIGASKGVLSRAIKSNTDIQCKWLELIVENYPDISTRWLITGTGEMLHTPISKHVAQVTGNKNSVMQGGHHANQTQIKDSDENLLRIIDKQAEQLAKAQEQISKLIDVISNK